jgi:hypothetical protein
LGQISIQIEHIWINYRCYKNESLILRYFKMPFKVINTELNFIHKFWRKRFHTLKSLSQFYESFGRSLKIKCSKSSSKWILLFLPT